MFAPTILLVDDDAVMRDSLRRYLTCLPLRSHVLEAEDGQQALALVQAHCQAGAPPHSLLVLLDLNMPVMDGLEFLEHQKRLSAPCQQTTVVVVISASTDTAECARARTLAVDFQPKPLNSAQLADLVRQHLPMALAA